VLFLRLLAAWWPGTQSAGDTGDNHVLVCNSVTIWAMCKQSAPRSRQISTSTPHHSIFIGRVLFLTPNQQRQNTEGTHLPVVMLANVKSRLVLPFWYQLTQVVLKKGY